MTDRPDTPAAFTVPALLTVPAAAQILGIGTRTAWRRVADGSLPAVRDHGRTMVRGDELRGYIDQLARAGGGGNIRPRKARPRPYVSLID